MANEAQIWLDKVQFAADHAERVYKDEVERLERQIEAADKKEGREVKHVEHQVEFDAALADFHVKYLERVIKNEIARVERAYERLVKKQASGASDAAVQRAAEHAVKVEDAAAAHVERATKSVIAHIERDVKAAARHVVKGLDRLGLDEDDLEDDLQADAARVAKALEEVGVEVEK